MTAPPIEAVIDRLTEDLVGPSDPHEIIEDRPSDRYLTGILFPQETPTGPEEDDRLALSEGGDEDGASSEEPTLTNSTRPSTAGVSFAATGQNKPTCSFLIRCGMYTSVSAAEAGTSAEASGAGQPSASKKRLRWKRFPKEVHLSDQPLVSGAISLEHWGLPGVELYLDVVPWNNAVLVTAVVVNRMVPRAHGRVAIEEASLFQVELICKPGPQTRFPARPSVISATDSDSASAHLLYRDAREFAVGHTCSARWTKLNESFASEVAAAWLPIAGVPRVSAAGAPEFRSIPRSSLRATELASASEGRLTSLLSGIPQAYRAWMAKQRVRMSQLPPELNVQAEKHLAGCTQCCDRIEAAIGEISRDAVMREAFQLANAAMDLQYRWVRGETAELQWHPFQMAFLLLSIESAAGPSHPHRSVMDLLWFPTGGGKTEAYLGLIAFVIFIRRLKDPLRGAGVAAFMRYTLRLLTTQQFQRAAALILACETLRRQRRGLGARLGQCAISIGIWVGQDAVANTVAEALEALATRAGNRPDQLDRCPACKAKLRWGPGLDGRSVHVNCLTPTCALNAGHLPVWTVDEDVYREVPSLLIGTVDKYAQIVRKPESAKLFGLGTPHSPPDLIIQDELHLISGPLGTLAGLYEVAIDRMVAESGARPKVVGSTATIRRAADQIRALFDREAQLFPPPGLDASDSGFAVPDNTLPGRRYLAITTAGRSAKFTLQAVLASALQSAGALSSKAEMDGYWTAVGYFNALRELGGALVLVQDDVPSTIRQLAARRTEPERMVGNVAELTSRVSQAELKERLEELDFKAGQAGAIDVLLATNMISVGVDIQRLALMIVMGQPKTVAEYIQATSRVGRGSSQGLVMVVYNHNKARDRSRFESFATWHQTLYREVEATSVTPFSSRARDRALHAILVALTRHLVPAMYGNPNLGDHVDLTPIAMEIADRAARVASEEAAETGEQLDEIIARWRHRGPLKHYWNDHAPRQSLLISAERAATLRAAGMSGGEGWPTPNSLRSVEPATTVEVIEHLKAEE